MALISKKCILFVSFMVFAGNVMANVVYERNAIQLLDNRFRIDPNTEQVTVVLNHPNHSQKVVLVKPDGSKWYAERHPKKIVAWLNTRDQDIITIQNPTPGPWQAIANLHEDNRVQLLNPISMQVGRIPVRTYRNEYITTDISLIKDGEIMSNRDFLKNARLTVTLKGKAKKLISLYKDDGQNYDALPFDGKLTTHMFMNLIPGRYSLSIKTRNNIFVREYNKDVVVFPSPITFNTEQLALNAASVRFTFRVDASEIDPDSVVIDGAINSYKNKTSQQSIIHLAEHKPRNNVFTIKIPLGYDLYTYTAKAYATTRDGREITLQLSDRTFELVAPYIPEPVDEEALKAEQQRLIEEQARKEQQYWYLIMLLSGLAVLIALIVVVAIYLIKRKQRNLSKDDGLSLDELTVDELQPTSIDIDDDKMSS